LSTASVDLFRDFLPAPQICKAFCLCKILAKAFGFWAHRLILSGMVSTHGLVLFVDKTHQAMGRPFQMAEVAVPREFFRSILQAIGRRRLPAVASG